MGDDETVFMDESIKTSYNSLHDLQQVALESQNHHATTLSGRNHGAQKWGVKFTRFTFYISGQCRLFDPDSNNSSFLPPLTLSASRSGGVDSVVLHRVLKKLYVTHSVMDHICILF
jgi:hypothetical protein